MQKRWSQEQGPDPYSFLLSALLPQTWAAASEPQEKPDHDGTGFPRRPRRHPLGLSHHGSARGPRPRQPCRGLCSLLPQLKGGEKAGPGPTDPGLRPTRLCPQPLRVPKRRSPVSGKWGSPTQTPAASCLRPPVPAGPRHHVAGGSYVASSRPRCLISQKEIKTPAPRVKVPKAGPGKGRRQGLGLRRGCPRLECSLFLEQTCEGKRPPKCQVHVYSNAAGTRWTLSQHKQRARRYAVSCHPPHTLCAV